MPEITAAPPNAPIPSRVRNTKLYRRFPTIATMRKAARKKLPYFAFAYLDGGAGEDTGIARNWRALDAVELMPRYGVTTELPPIETELFGRRYAGPFGVSPMGSPSLGFPGADRHLAAAAQIARLPYTLSAVGGMTIEDAGTIAPDVLWFQLPRLPREQHKLGLDMVRRAEEAGAHVLMLTMDTPIRTTRPREVQSGITSPFKPDLWMMASILASPIGELQALCPEPQCDGNGGIRSQGILWRFHLGRGCHVSRPLEAPAAGQRTYASARRRERDRHRLRRHCGIEPRRPADRRAAGTDRCAARHRGEGGKPRHCAHGFGCA
jgi:hypothetical protein